MSKHASCPFNPDIANTFFRAGLIESWGRGIERIIDTCKQGNYPAPKWQLEPGGLWVIFEFHKEHARQFADEAVQASPPVTPPVAALLKILADKDEQGNAEIHEAMQLKDRRNLRDHYINPALEQWLIEYTLPDKPTSSKQKYRITTLVVRSHGFVVLYQLAFSLPLAELPLPFASSWHLMTAINN